MLQIRFQFTTFPPSVLTRDVLHLFKVWFIVKPHVKVIISFALIKGKYDYNKSTNKSQTGYYRNTNEGNKNTLSRDIVICNLISLWDVGVINA